MAELKDDGPAPVAAPSGQPSSPALPVVERASVQKHIASEQPQQAGVDEAAAAAAPATAKVSQKLDLLAALLNLRPGADGIEQGTPRYIQELQGALQKFMSFQSAGDKRESASPESDAGISIAAAESAIEQSAALRQHGPGELTDPVRQVALPAWTKDLLDSPLQIDQDVALTLLAQYVVHAGLTQYERQHPEQGMRAAEACIARLGVASAQKREAALKAVEGELARRRSEAFSEEIRLESEARAGFDRIVEHTFFSIDETLPGLELFGRTTALPGELRTLYVDNPEKTVDLLCQEALERAAAGEELPVRYLVGYASEILSKAETVDSPLDNDQLLRKLERRYLDGLHSLYAERFPLESLHQLDLSLSRSKNLEEAFTILAGMIPGGDRHVFSSYALSTLNRVAAHQNHDIGLLIGQASRFGFSVGDRPVVSLQITVPQEIKTKCNEARILEHARTYAGLTAEVQIRVPQPLVSERFRALSSVARQDSAGTPVSDLFIPQKRLGQAQSEMIRPFSQSRDGSASAQLKRLTDDDATLNEPILSAQRPLHIGDLEIEPTDSRRVESLSLTDIVPRARSTVADTELPVQALGLQIKGLEGQLSSPRFKAEEFLVEQLSQFVKDKDRAPLHEYVTGLMHSVEWIQFEFNLPAEPSSMNPFTTGVGQLDTFGLSIRKDQLQSKNPRPFQIPGSGTQRESTRLREELGPTTIARCYAVLAMDVFERRVQQDLSGALAQRDLFKLEEVLRIVSEVEPHLRAIAGRKEDTPSLYQDLVRQIRTELAKDLKEFPVAEAPTYRALGLGFRNGLCDPQQVAASLRHLSQCGDIPAVLHQVAQRGAQIRELRAVHDTPATLTSVEVARSSRLESLRNEIGVFAGKRTFLIEVESRLEQDTVLGPAESPRVVVTADTTVGDLCRLLFRAREAMEGDLNILTALNRELVGGSQDESLHANTKIPAGTILNVAGTPLGFEIQQAAAVDRVRRLREELRVCIDPTERQQLEHFLQVSEVFDSFVQREGNMLSLQRQIDQCALELEAASVVAAGNAQRLRNVFEEFLPRSRDALLAERKRLVEVEVALSARLEQLKSRASKALPGDSQLLELTTAELKGISRYRAALSGSGAQNEDERALHRSPTTALAEVAFLAEQRTQEYLLGVQEEMVRLGAIAAAAPHSKAEERSTESRRLELEKAAAVSAASRSSSAVANLLSSLADVSTGTHTSDVDLMLRRASLVLASAGERELAQGGLTRESVSSVADRFFAAGKALSYGSRLSGLEGNTKLELQRAAGEMYAKAYEYRAAATENTEIATKDLGRALSWIVSNAEDEGEAFSFVSAENTTPNYLDSRGDLSSWGVFTTKIAALQSVEVERLSSRIASLPESRRARALELLAQVVDRNSSQFEKMMRDSSVTNFRDTAYRALQVAQDVPSRAIAEPPEVAEARRRIYQQVERGKLTEAEAGAAFLAQRGELLKIHRLYSYDSESFIVARGIRARFLLAYADSKSTEGAIDSEFEVIRSEIRDPRGARGRRVAEVAEELDTERNRVGAGDSTDRLALLERELVEAQVREARMETLVTRMDGLALSAFTQLASNPSSGSREKFALRVASVVEEAIARDEACFREQSARMMQSPRLDEAQKKVTLEAVRRAMRARHADMHMAIVQAHSAAARFDLAEEHLTLLESMFQGEMSPSTSKVVKDVRERHAKGEPWSAAFTAALNEAQTGGSLTQSVGFAVSGAATGAAIGVWFFGVGAPVGAVIGGIIGLVADKGTNVYRGRSRIGAAFSTGVSGVDGSQTGVNMLTLGVDIVTAWLPLRGAGSVVSKVGFGGLARGTLNAEAKAAFSSQLNRMFAEAGVTSARELGEQGVTEVTRRMVRHEFLQGLGQHGGKILAAQIGTAGGMYGYNRFSIEFSETLSQEEKDIAIKHLNQEAATHGGILLAMVGVGGALGHRSNRAWSNKAAKLTEVVKLRGQERVVANSIIERWGANLRPTALGSRGGAVAGAAATPETSAPSRVGGSSDTATSGSARVQEPVAAPDKKIFGQDAARTLAKLAKENLQAKEVFEQLFKRFESRGNLEGGYLLESELNAARAGRLADSPDIPPPTDGPGAGGDGGNDPGSPSPGGGQGDVPAEYDYYTEEFRSFLSGDSTGGSSTIQNSLKSFGAREGGVAVKDGPVRATPRITEPSSGPRIRSGDAVKPSTRQTAPSGNTTASAQGTVAGVEAPTVPSNTAVESVQLVRPLIETSPSLVTEGLGMAPTELPFLEEAGLLSAPSMATRELLTDPRLKKDLGSAPLFQPNISRIATPLRPDLSNRIESLQRAARTDELPELDIPLAPRSRSTLSPPRVAATEIQIPSEAVQPSLDELVTLVPEDTTITRRPAPTGIELSQVEPADLIRPDTLLRDVPRLAKRAEPTVDLPEVDVPPVRLSRPAPPVPSVVASEIQIPFEAVQPSIEDLAALEPHDTTISRRPAPASIELLEEALVPAPFTVGVPAPTELPRISPKPEILPISPAVAGGTEAMLLSEVSEEVEPFAVPLPRRQLTQKPTTDAHPQQIPQPRPEQRPTHPRVAQATEEQGKRKRELEFGSGSDTKRPEDRRIQEERKIPLAEGEELRKKKEKRRSGRRVARRVVAGEIGSFTVDEDQQTEYDKYQFTSSRMRSSEGRDE